jgi:hypothetical protein
MAEMMRDALARGACRRQRDFQRVVEECVIEGARRGAQLSRA